MSLLLAIPIHAEIASGDGWSISDDGVLTLSKSFSFGYGSMKPWDSYKESFSSVVIADGVTSIGDYAFYKYSGLTSVTIGNGVTSIGNYAFYGCSGLTSINIPDGVSSIGNSAFEGCRGLTSVTIPNSVTSIGNSAFEGCRGLTSVTIPNSVTSFGSDAFYGCSGLTRVDYGGTIGDWIKINFSDYDSNPLRYAEHLHIDGKEVTDVVIPDDVTSIGSYAFYGCSGLTSVTIPNSVTSFGDYAFSGCSGLTSVTIGNSVTSIGTYAFYSCIGLTSVTIPDGVTSIGRSAFEDCSGLTRVDYGGTIGDWVKINFSNYSSSPLYYAKHLHIDGKEVTDVVIPDGVTSIGNHAFCSCIGLTSVSIPNSVTSIGSYAFTRCSGLTSVTIPNSVTSIGYAAFSGCSCLTSITIPENSKLTSIGEFAFTDCSGLTSINIPDGVTSIGQYAFSGCSGLTSVTIPNSVTSIERYAFLKCSKLKEVHTDMADPSILKSALDPSILKSALETSMKYIVPCSLYDTYVAAGMTTESEPHLPAKTDAVGETCTTDGNSEYYTCSICKKYFSDAEASTEIAADSWVISAKGHTEVTDNAVEATCTATGLTEGKHCSVCNEVLVAQESVAMIDHLFTNYTYNNDAEVGVDGTETAECEHGCGATDSRTAEGTKLNPTGIENIKADGHKVVKTIEDGKIVIIRDGEKFDVMGRKIR